VLLFGPNIFEKPFDVGVEFNSYLSQPGLRDERIVYDVKALVPLIRVPGQDALGSKSNAGSLSSAHASSPMCLDLIESNGSNVMPPDNAS
jgi:hypothetical protein